MKTRSFILALAAVSTLAGAQQTPPRPPRATTPPERPAPTGQAPRPDHTPLAPLPGLAPLPSMMLPGLMPEMPLLPDLSMLPSLAPLPEMPLLPDLPSMPALAPLPEMPPLPDDAVIMSLDALHMIAPRPGFPEFPLLAPDALAPMALLPGELTPLPEMSLWPQGARQGARAAQRARSDAEAARMEAELARASSRANAEAMRAEADVARAAQRAEAEVAREMQRVESQIARAQAAAESQAARVAQGAAQTRIYTDDYYRLRSTFDEFESARPRASWAPQDAGDSLWRSARELINRGEWGQAAQAFRNIPQRFPNSTYAADALYWQAFALYRIGSTADLRNALTALETREQRYPNARSQTDAPALATRIRGVLASRGDTEAAAALARTASQGATCDREEQMVQAEAMNALSRSAQPEEVNTLIQRVLARRDECSVPLRKSAVFLASNRRDASSPGILIGVARNDPSVDVRVDAISALGKLPGEEGLAVLEELVRTSDDERIQRAAVRALVSHSSSRARTAVRSLIERNDVSDRLRADALSAFSPERATADDVAWLRQLYGRLDNVTLKQRALSAIVRIGGPDVDQWLVTIVRDDNERSEFRSTALRRIGQTLPVADLGRLYDSATQRRVREEIISLLGNRKEDAATDKLIDIVKTGTDPNLRTRAISALANKDNARARALLLEIINK